jgi:hypothetical protein
MGVKLAAASGGSIELVPTNTASNFTVTVPAVTGTAVVQNASNNLLMNSGYGSDAVAYGCRAWVNFDGTGTVGIRASGNVTSITDNGTGDYTVNFTTAMPDVNYACACSAATSGSGSATGASIGDVTTATSSTRFRTFFGTTQYDCFNVGVAIFR